MSLQQQISPDVSINTHIHSTYIDVCVCVYTERERGCGVGPEMVEGEHAILWNIMWRDRIRAGYCPEWKMLDL